MFKKFGFGSFGFGFNKDKSRAAAERCLQQNKLQSAIVEYEKILKVEPNDLTIVNQIGDIYSRLGHSEKAIARFRHVGDSYINDGSYVKAIAMYKKITKLDPNALPEMEKLAELYRKQGLVSDARSMLLHVAEAFTKRGQSKETLRILKQLVVFDPENVQVISRTAELMTQAGQKSEAKEMLSQTASTLVERRSMEPARKILEKLISIDPANHRAQELQAQVTLELGDAAKAAELFEAIPDLDSRPDALRNLVYALLATAKLDEASVVSRKLITVHHDAEGVLRVADALYKEGDVLRSIGLYEEFFAELISVDKQSVLEHLHGAVARVRTNAEPLQRLYNLFQRAGEVAMIPEVLELLAHACVQDGQMERARDVYQQLIDLEPDNATHQQEYRQVCARLDPNAAGVAAAPGKPEVPRTLEEFRCSSEPELPPQNYAPEVADVISAALTEAELYESLASRTQGITVLERALQKAADDLRLNYTLGRLYRQEGDGNKAARCYFTMQRVLEGLGAKPAADYYGDMAVAAGKITEAIEVAGAEFSASEFKLDDALGGTSAFTATEFSIEDDALGGTEEIDLSDEWQSVWQDEHEPAAQSAGRPPAASALSASKIPELLEEAHFCLNQQIWDEAESAINNLARIFPEHPELADLRSRLKQGKQPAESPYATSSYAAASPATPSATSAPAAAPDTDFYGGVSDDLLEIAGPRTASQDPLGSLAAELDQALGDEFLGGPRSASAQPAAAPAKSPAASKAAPQPTPEPESSVFGDLLQDFERDLSAQPESVSAEDPETHFSLGMAFRDMGLLDEAIGELQKVCRQAKSLSPQRAHQAYVWLATCFVEKSVPEASFKWFERALETAPDEESHNAVNYELANAYEAAGRKKEALERFLEVYGSNIDYRDVASRIKDLRASL